MIRTTPISSRTRKARTCATSELPAMPATTLAAPTKSGPYGEAVERHTLAIDESSGP